MLLKLSIKNYILIHDLEIDFTEGFSVITGETGAGKSILLGALALILGQRADSGILLDNSKKCVIEGLFRISGYQLDDFFIGQELDYDDTIILRREINQQGKSRAFINDTPVNLALMKDLGDRLVNVHSQHSIITLNDSNFQLAVIDSYAGIQAEVVGYRTSYTRFTGLKKQLAEMESQEARAAGELDYFQFLLDELHTAQLLSGELQETENKLSLLNHAEEVKSSLFKANDMISGTDDNILANLTQVLHIVNGVAKYKPEIRDIAERLNSNLIDIKDISNELDLVGEQVFVDPPLMESLTMRLDHLYRLIKKHQVSTIEELLTIKLDLQEKVSEEAGMEERVKALRGEIAGIESDLMGKARAISANRQRIIPEFEKEVVGILGKLGIRTAQFTIEFLRSSSITKDGTDKVKFLFSANKGIELKDLSSSASGGELSRIMLAIKSMISQKNLLPTIIFDEIDNGVSGEVAGKVGTILKRMGSYMQVIAITHLPQIAAKGDRHYWVFKTENNQTTVTFIKELSASERVGEIAKMLSDETVTDSALQSALEMLKP
ncbi:MAG: DNA repair protein RecN [bacterium]